MDFVSGGVAGACANMCTNPMDVIKTRLQLQGELRARTAHTHHYRGFLHATYLVGKTEGLLALQSGMVPSMVYGLIMNGLRLGLYNIADKQSLNKTDGALSLPKALFYSSVTGAAGAVVAHPSQVVKARMQAAHPSRALGRRHRYKGLVHAFRSMIRSDGFRGLFVGVQVSCVRLAFGSGAQITAFSAAKDQLRSNGFCDHSPVVLSFYASVICGVFTSVAECPIDVVCTRLMTQGNANSTQGILYHGALDCTAKIYKTEGLHGFYKGLGPLYLRMAPHTTIMLVTWDTVNRLARDFR